MPQNQIVEIAFSANTSYDDPYNDVELEALVTTPGGEQLRVPAFWAGGNVWKVRIAGDPPGNYAYTTAANVDSDDGLHGQTGSFTVDPYDGDNALLRHGRLRLADDRRHFEHTDGTPFFWTGDSWLMGLTKRLDWPNGFKELTDDRVAKGFNVIQIVAGPLPDMGVGDPRGRNEAGLPFTENFERVNPSYYDHADLKFAYLVEAGLMPCIIGMWGYYLKMIGLEAVKRYWRYLVARYGAYPVVWCICGEGIMPYYLSESPEEDAALQKRGWTEVIVYVRSIDPYGNLISIHPTLKGREQVEDPSVMDFEMLQAAHRDIGSVVRSIEQITEAVDAEPVMPVIEAEVNFEGILGRSWQNVQRLNFYHAVMRGTAGHNYGANGIWQMSTTEEPYGRSPHGRSWGEMPWQEAAQLPGSRQVGLGGQFIRRFPWWALEPRPDWIRCEPDWTWDWPGDAVIYGPVCAGIPRQLRIVYMPMFWTPGAIVAIESDVSYTAYWFDPCTGKDIDIGPVEVSDAGEWTPPLPGECHDWLLVLTSTETAS